MANTAKLSPASETQPLLNGFSHLSPSGQMPHDVVDFSAATHPLNPKSMSRQRKWWCAFLLGLMTFSGTFASSVFNAAIIPTAIEFNVSPSTMSLATSLFDFGFATGPILMGAAAEWLGRKLPFFAAYSAFILFQVPVALAGDAQTVLVFRFLSGVASSASPAIVGGYLADFLESIERGVAVAIFAAMTLTGPEIGAIVGAILVQSDLGWRWTAWVSMILGALVSVIGFLVLPETYLPVVEQRYAHQMRGKAGNWALHSKKDEETVSLRDFAVRYLTRPITMLCLEPILALMTFYVSFVFGLVYLLFVVCLLRTSQFSTNSDDSMPGISYKFCTRTWLFTCFGHSTTSLDMRRYHIGCFLRI